MKQHLFGGIAAYPAVGFLKSILPKIVPVILVLGIVWAIFALKSAYVDKPLAAEKKARVAAEATAKASKEEAEKEKAAKLVALNERDVALVNVAKLAKAVEVQNTEVRKANAAFTAQAQNMRVANSEIARLSENTNRLSAGYRSQAILFENRLPADPRQEVATARAGLKETKGFDYAKIN